MRGLEKYSGVTLLPIMRALPLKSLAGVLAICITASAASERTVYIVRHAEKEQDLKKDGNPGLTKKGLQRAEALVGTLKDAQIETIYVSELKRTQETALPLTRALRKAAIVIPNSEVTSLPKKILTQSGNVLVVGHSDTIPDLIRALGVDTNVKVLPNAYDNLFVVTLGKQPTLDKRKYP